MTADQTQASRIRMVEEQIASRGVRDSRVLDAMKAVHRERFLPPDQVAYAYHDRALPVGQGQTISQPYIVALMTELLRIEASHRVLEIGTGTGYQTAVLAMLAEHVHTVERLDVLSAAAQHRLGALGHDNVSYRIGDGSVGWAEAAPFDRIIVTAAAPTISTELTDQLAEGGRLVIPVGDAETQRLTVVERHDGKTVERPSIAVRFVKLIGESGFPS